MGWGTAYIKAKDSDGVDFILKVRYRHGCGLEFEDWFTEEDMKQEIEENK